MNNFPKFKKILTLSLGTLAYAYLFYHLFSKEDIAQILDKLRFNFLDLLLILLIWFVYLIAQGFYLQKAFQRWKIRLSIYESTNLWLASVALGIVTLGIGGLAVIIHHLKKNNLDSKTIAKITFDYYAGYVSSVVLLIASTFIIASQSIFMQITLSAVMAIIIIALWLRINWKLAVYAFPSVILNLLLFMQSFRILNIAQPVLDYIKAFDLNIFLSIASPSGGGLGFVEVGMVKYLQYTGLPISAASSATLLYRLISLWFTALIGYFSLVRIYKK